MADYPPLMNAYGLVPKILEKIKEAKTPARFTQDFLGTNLGFPGGSAKPFIPLAKRLGLLSSDGTPTELYQQFRNPDHTKGAMARALRSGYSQLFDRNEYANKLDKKGLEGLVVQATGLDKGSTTLRAIVNTFDALKAFADFDAAGDAGVRDGGRDESVDQEAESQPDLQDDGAGAVRMNLAYTINLNLPKSDDIAVFSAIFRALREQLLRK